MRHRGRWPGAPYIPRGYRPAAVPRILPEKAAPVGVAQKFAMLASNSQRCGCQIDRAGPWSAKACTMPAHLLSHEPGVPALLYALPGGYYIAISPSYWQVDSARPA